ncbi:PadR family transcriptional regulator [Pseudoclavibacter sp. VKM Ac-2888]|uniref:PadR family transcriptional regulator n=1 Tax=Pseudoclavibacter sp. VKM Ac-2888 TaxID=2783830 RepID=UPI001E2ACBE8|nr:helix-turn-helix transcriptional regulator [Pseudoclavibacter sp. VKM Ac-2888]
MKELSFWVLTSLAGGRQHGYGILRDAEQLSGGSVKLSVTSLYASLDRLEHTGQIRRAGEETVDGRARRYFELTAEGRESLLIETQRLQERARTAEQRLASLQNIKLKPGPVAMRGAVAL